MANVQIWLPVHRWNRIIAALEVLAENLKDGRPKANVIADMSSLHKQMLKGVRRAHGSVQAQGQEKESSREAEGS